jgi:hypothetical protein
MKVIILALLVCAWAQDQFEYNLCTTTSCTISPRCGDAGYPDYLYPSDRSGYTCDEDTQKCIAPQCSSYVGFNGLFPTAFAPVGCPAPQICGTDFQCQAPPPQPQAGPTPHTPVYIGLFMSAGEPGEYCQYDTQCMAGYCDTTKNQCVQKQACPATCTNDNQCLEGVCVKGTCTRGGLKEIGGKCAINGDCYSNSCVGEVCTGTDCSNFNCKNNGYWCNYERSLTASPPYQPTCYPDYETFVSSCPIDTNYAVRNDTQTVSCVPKKAAGISCKSNVECVSNNCDVLNGGLCLAYDNNRIPLGKSCFGGICAPGLLCSFKYVCIKLGQQGDNCQGSFDCSAGLVCANSKCTPQGKDGDICVNLGSDYCADGLLCNPLTLKCSPYFQEGESCFDYNYCDTGLICNTATYKCSQLGKEGDRCGSQRECETGLWCNSATYICSQLGTEGDLCTLTADCNINKEFVCIYNSTDSKSSCRKSPTIGKPCAWDYYGKHNCTYNPYGEMCVCFDGGPKCVLVSSDAYLAKIQPYLPKPPEPVPDNSEKAAEIQLKIDACHASLEKEPPYLISTDLQLSYYKYLTGCDRLGLDDKCRSYAAKERCCEMCKVDTDYQKNIDPEDKFYSFALGPFSKLSCGDNPNIEYHPSSCEGPTILSWNEIKSRFSCAGKSYPYAKITFTVTYDGYISLSEAKTVLGGLIKQQIYSEGSTLPDSISYDTDETGKIVVTLTYLGDGSSGDNISGVQDTLSSDTFEDKVSNSIEGAKVSDVTIKSSSTRHILSMIALIGFVLIGLLF